MLDWTAQFNQIVKDGVAGMAGVVLIDSGEPINDAIANPAKYGLVDVRKPGCTKTTPTASATSAPRPRWPRPMPTRPTCGPTPFT